MSILNSRRKYILQSVLAFLLGSQLVHIYMKPLDGIEQLTAEKKSRLWRDYFEEKAAKK